MTLITAMSRGWTAAAAAAILATVAALAFLGIASAASVSDLTVGSATVAPGDSVTIDVTATVDGVGSYRVDVNFDESLVKATSCTSTNGVCAIDTEAPVGTPVQLRMNGANLAGITGDDVVLGTITFEAVGDAGSVAALTVDADTLVVSDVEGEILTVTATAGAITIEAAATPSPTPAAVPKTGGAPGASSTNSLAWLLAASGLVIVAGGAWVLARAGREN